MRRVTSLAAFFLFAITLGLLVRPRLIPAADKTEAPQKEKPFGLEKRVPWTTSRIIGSPEPPHPYHSVRAFPNLVFDKPVLMTLGPTGDRFFVVEEKGRIYSFADNQKVKKVDLAIDLRAEVHSWDAQSKIRSINSAYALAFHPHFEKNRFCYICYILDSKNRGEQLSDGTRVSRFRVTDTNPPRIDPRSEKVIITWLAGGHNGCDMHFGPDGFLYISTGDGTSPNPPDARDTGQDISDLLSSILRIDVDKEENGRAYAIPPDNPFIKTAGARPEVWAYGFRNPWRMSFDRVTGDLWVGDVGWELWEMVFRIKKGGNYGWSVMEGRQPVHPEGRRGPTPILPPTLDFPHTEAASITGGYVYRGKRYRDLQGAYICGDWVTRKLWATRFDGDRIVWHKVIAQTNHRIVGFAQDRNNELYYVHHEDKGTLHRLAPNEKASERRSEFPRKLSETGLFTSVKDHTIAPGVVAFSVNVAQWADHTTSERFLALPGNDSRVKLYDSPISIPGGFFSGQVFFPKDGVLARTISLEMERGNPASRRRLETQIMHYDGEVWRGYTYAWNDEQTDAALVAATGVDRTFTVKDGQAPGGTRRHHWHFPSRTECLTCHNPWGGQTLAFTPEQLNRDHDYGTVSDNQLRTLRHVGLVELLQHDEDTRKARPLSVLPAARLTAPHGPKGSLEDRVRSYLHVNCAHCHRFGAGGSVDIDLRHEVPVESSRTLEVHPTQGSFGIPGAQILAPGDPYRSVLYYRMAKLGRGRMPHMGSEMVDERGLRLVHEWIRQLPMHKDERSLIERLKALDEQTVLAREKRQWARRLAGKAAALARARGREKPTAGDRQKAEGLLRAESATAARARAAERESLVRRLLASTPSALLLARELGEGRVPVSVRGQVVAAATASDDPAVRDLFERFVPDEQRARRLGSVVRPEAILSLKGDAARGRGLFFKTSGLQCVNCHRAQGMGSTLGPDLGDVGKRLTRAQILESILAPSKTVDPKYLAYVVETTDGKVHTGLLAGRNAREVVLKQAGDKEVRIPAGKVERIAPQRNSLMPELLLRDLTAEQAADLLAFLASLR
jgi:putative heme-binding domain-containing protein